MAQSIDIPIDEWMEKINVLYQKISDWLVEFFRTIDTYESVAVGGIGLGFIMLIVGIILI